MTEIQNDTERAIAAVFIEAGWAPHFGLRGYCKPAGKGWLVGGAPDPSKPLVTHMKVTEKDADSPDTPDDPVEAARWLVARFPVAPAAEPEQTPAHEAHSETGAEAAATAADGVGGYDELVGMDDSSVSVGDDLSVRLPAGLGDMDAGGAEGLDEVSDGDADEFRSEASVADADFSEPLPELGQELAEEHPEEYAASVAIFGDNLDQKRTAAIGLVMRHARSLMPFWTSDSDIALIELRNYAMGAAEGRWAQDEHRARELQEMEATLSRMNAIAAARDAKVEFLESATREEVEAFDPEANWP